jgi:hypothetical protein
MPVDHPARERIPPALCPGCAGGLRALARCSSPATRSCLTTTMTTVGRPDTRTYATIKPLSRLVAGSARACGSKGHGCKAFRAHSALEASPPPLAIAYDETAETRRNPRSDENLDHNRDDSCSPSGAYTNICGRSRLVTVARTGASGIKHQGRIRPGYPPRP